MLNSKPRIKTQTAFAQSKASGFNPWWLKPLVRGIVAAAVAAREGATFADLHGRLLQELSVTTRRFRAQASLRRRAEIIRQTQPFARASAVLLED